MITSQDIHKLLKKDLIPLVSSELGDRIPSQRRHEKTYRQSDSTVAVTRANKDELIAALESVQKPVTPTLSIDMFQLNADELTEVKSAMEISGMNLLELARAGLLLKARRLNTDYNKVKDLTPEQRRNTTLSGAAISNLRETANRIVQWNHACYNNDLRVYLNASILRNLTGSNLNTIKDFLSVYRTPDEEPCTAEEHNQQYKLTDKDNRKGRDEFGNKIKISELIKQPLPQKPVDEVKTEEVTVQPQEQSKPVEQSTKGETPQEDFAKRIDAIESDTELKTECEALMEQLIKQNGSKSFSSFKKLVEPYRKQIKSLRLRSHNSEAKLIASVEGMKPENWLKDNSELPKGAEFNEQGNIISYPVHKALKHLSAEAYKSRFAK